jgi:hypothetical protein
LVKITTTRQFQSRPSQRTATGGYESIEQILEDPDKRVELLLQVMKEIMAYRRRYAELSELDGVWQAVDEVAADLAPSPAVVSDQPIPPIG